MILNHILNTPAPPIKIKDIVIGKAISKGWDSVADKEGAQEQPIQVQPKIHRRPKKSVRNSNES